MRTVRISLACDPSLDVPWDSAEAKPQCGVPAHSQGSDRKKEKVMSWRTRQAHRALDGQCGWHAVGRAIRGWGRCVLALPGGARPSWLPCRLRVNAVFSTPYL